MPLFDLHCDVLWRLSKEDCPVEKTESQPMFAPKKRCQAFALFFEESGDAVSSCEKQLAVFDRLVADQVIETTAAEGKICGFLTIENAGMLPDDYLKNLFAARGPFPFVSLTWNGENRFGYGQGAEDRPLKAEGLSFLQYLKEKGSLPDVSHLSARGFYSVAEHFQGPIVATHSNAAAIFNHKRNLTDDQIRTIVSSGGLVGLNLHYPFLTEQQPTDLLTSYRLIFDQISHFLSLGGEDVLAFGADFDGGTPIFGLEREDRLVILRDAMVQYFGDRITSKIFFNNAATFFAEHFSNI